MPSKPLPDRRKNIELSAEEVQVAIAERRSRARRQGNQAIGGYVVGFAGLAFAFVTALVLNNTLMAALGFVMSLVGFGVASVKQIAEIFRAIKGG